MKKLTIKHTVSAPTTKVWEAFTNADILKQWWSPEQMTCSHASIDLQENGVFRYCFKGKGGKEYWGRGVYQSLNKPSFLSYLDTFTDAEGNPVPPSYLGIPRDEIVETLVEFHFEEDGHTTKLTMVGECDYDDAMEESMIAGWKGMFEKLNVLLEV